MWRVFEHLSNLDKTIKLLNSGGGDRGTLNLENFTKSPLSLYQIWKKIEFLSDFITSKTVKKESLGQNSNENITLTP